jgi:hypothetical protein
MLTFSGLLDFWHIMRSVSGTIYYRGEWEVSREKGALFGGADRGGGELCGGDTGGGVELGGEQTCRQVPSPMRNLQNQTPTESVTNGTFRMGHRISDHP